MHQFTLCKRDEDYGTALIEAEEDLATEVLVFLVSGVHAKGMKVHAVVFDGTYGNQSTAVKLGCEIEAENMKTWFSHPDDPQSKIHVIFDICHMLEQGKGI